jgi:ferredoxin-NADP reductase
MVAGAAPESAIAFICGSNGFVEAAGQLAMQAGIEPSRILTERFGPTS